MSRPQHVALMLSISLLVFVSKNATAEPPPQALIEKLTEAIREHCPEAEIEVADGALVAKSGTMLFTVHSRSKTGEVYSQTYQQEGPNYKGFLLRVSLEDGRYEGAAVVPQTLGGPYYPTFIDAPPTEEGRKYYRVNFSYGSRLDAELKTAVFQAIPRTRFEPAP